MIIEDFERSCKNTSEIFFKINYNLQVEIIDDKHNQSPDDNLPNDLYIKEFI